jgi:hypothetical protein
VTFRLEELLEGVADFVGCHHFSISILFFVLFSKYRVQN